MTALKTLLAFGMLLLPCAAGAEECQVIEFPDHFEATCIGDAKPYSIPRSEISGRTAVPAAPETPQQQEAPRQQEAVARADQSAGAPGIEPARPPVPGQGGTFRRGRQGRPSTADMNAVLEARRRLIQQSAPQPNQQ
jgi:hypothetical protein